MGIDHDLMTGAKKATRAMIDWLTAEHGLSREDAYVLCSVAGDLKILETVDSGVWNVGMTMPLSISSADNSIAGPMAQPFPPDPTPPQSSALSAFATRSHSGGHKC
jgi:hypothetical protein